MGLPVLKPVSLKTAITTFKIGAATASDFSDHIAGVLFTPSASAGTSFTSTNGKVIQSSAVSTWTATIDLVQDMDPTGFLRYLLDNDGSTATVSFTPASGGKAITCDLTIAAAAVGGKADGGILQSSVTMACNGKPVFAA